MKLKKQILIVLTITLISMLVASLSLISIYQWQVISANQQATLEYLERDAVHIANAVSEELSEADNLEGGYDDLLAQRYARYMIIGSGGQIIDEGGVGLADESDKMALLDTVMENGRLVTLDTQGQIGNHSILDNKVIGGYRLVYNAQNQIEYLVLVGMSRSEAIETAYQRLQVLGVSAIFIYPFFFIIVILAILGSLSAFIIRNVSRPINDIKDGLKYLDRNNFSLKVDPVLLSRPNELGELARSASNLAHRFRDIQGTLEQKVEERTKQLEQEKHSLSQAKARTEAILRSIGEGLVVADATRTIIFVNDAAARITGFSTEELLGSKWPEIVNPVDAQGDPIDITKSVITRALLFEQSIYASDYALTTKHGEQVPVSITASAVHTSPDQSDGVIIVFRDITEEKAIDQAKSEFVSLASHQLRTPLSSINWFSELLLTGDAGDLSDEQKSYVEEIDESSQRMIDLVNALLNVSRVDLGTFIVAPEELNVKEIAQSVIAELEPDVFKKKIGLTEFYDDKLPVIKADPKLLRIVFQNLLSNAVKYCDDEGKIELRVELPADEPDYFLIVVKDTGYGIPKHQQEKIFSKLFRAENVQKRDTQGTGLGLYLVKSIVDYSQGNIRFESEENVGTTFYVTLPIVGMKSKKGTKELS